MIFAEVIVICSKYILKNVYLILFFLKNNFLYFFHLFGYNLIFEIWVIFLYFIKFNMVDIESYENKSINVLISTEHFIIFLLLKMVENKIQALKKTGIK